jgi:hypothetical protein
MKAWALVLIVGLGAGVPLQRWIDVRRGGGTAVEESLYITSGRTLRRASLGFNGLLADLYWLRAIQHFGERARQVEGPLNILNVKDWNLALLEPLLNITTELDPHYVAAYRFGALFLPDLNPEGAVRFVERGIRDNPGDWRLYQDLGYIFWRQGRYREASETYERGERDTAREMFRRIYESSDDPTTKGISLARLQSMQSEDEITFLNRLAASWRERSGACPPSLAELMKSLPPPSLDKFKAAGLQLNEGYEPLDPHGFAYAFDAASCTAALAKESTVVRWKN